MNNKILVTGATGGIGTELLKILSGMNLPVKAAARNPEKISKMNLANTEPYSFDFTNQDSYNNLMSGVNKLFLFVPSDHPEFDDITYKLTNHAKNSGVEKIVFLSAMGTEDADESPLFEAELNIQGSGIAYTFLRPNWFMQNFNTFMAKGIIENNEIAVPAGDAKTSFVDARDISAAAAAALTDTNHDNKAYTITGGESLSYYDVADYISKASGREIKYNNISDGHYSNLLLESGMDKTDIRAMVWFYQLVRRGESATVSKDLKTIIGREIYSFQQYANDYAGYWALK
ncbi:NmrA family NAD(P)-binding protein [Bacteroidota bacterium]